MKFKIYFLLALLWAAPALAMEQELTAENIVTHPRFLELRKKFEEIGGEIEISPRSIRLWLPSQPNSATQIHYDGPLWWHLEREVMKDRMSWLWKTLPNSLQGLCILELARNSQKTIAGIVAALPENLKEQIMELV